MDKLRQCKDCGTDQVIYKVRTQHVEIESELCSTCLQNRAQLQQIKEDKLSFPKLLAKIRSETAKRVSREIASVSGVERLYRGAYVGGNSYTALSQYWVEQLTSQV